MGGLVHDVGKRFAGADRLVRSDPLLNGLKGTLGMHHGSTNWRKGFQQGMGGLADAEMGGLVRGKDLVRAAPIAGSVIGGFFGPWGAAAGGAAGGYLASDDQSSSLKPAAKGAAAGLAGYYAGQALGGGGAGSTGGSAGGETAGSTAGETGSGLSSSAASKGFNSGLDPALQGTAGSTAGSSTGSGLGLKATSAGLGLNEATASGTFDSGVSGALPYSSANTGAGPNSPATGAAPFSSGLDYSLGGGTSPGLTAPTGGTGFDNFGAGPNQSFTGGGGASPTGAAPTSDPNAPISDISRQASPADIAKAKSTDSTWGEAKGLAQKYGLPVALLAANMRQKQPPQQDALNARQQEMNRLGNDLLAKYKSGAVSPTQQAVLDKFRSDAQSQAKQYLQNSGQGADSSAMQTMNQSIETNIAQQKQAMLDQMYNEGLQALQISDSATQQLIDLKLRQDQRSSQAMQNFMQQYFVINGMGGTK